MDVLRIAEFILTDGKESLRYTKFVLAVTDRPQMSVDMIFPASIFDHMAIKIDRMTSIVWPQVTIESKTDSCPVFFRQKKLTANQKALLGIKADIVIQNVYAEDETVRYPG